MIYPAGETFPVGGCNVHRASPDDQIALVGAGVTLHECLRAANELAAIGVFARVIDLYSLKPLDRDTLVATCHVTGSRLVIAENHYPKGGLVLPSSKPWATPAPLPYESLTLQ